MQWSSICFSQLDITDNGTTGDKIDIMKIKKVEVEDVPINVPFEKSGGMSIFVASISAIIVKVFP